MTFFGLMCGVFSSGLISDRLDNIWIRTSSIVFNNKELCHEHMGTGRVWLIQSLRSYCANASRTRNQEINRFLYNFIEIGHEIYQYQLVIITNKRKYILMIELLLLRKQLISNKVFLSSKSLKICFYKVLHNITP